MLDTLLEIGKVLQTADCPQLHHFCVAQPSVGLLKISMTTCVVPVQDDGTFVFGSKSIKPLENKRLAYLMLKEFATDNRKRYIFGDVYRLYDSKKKKEASGNYTVGKEKEKKGPYDKDSFDLAKEIAPTLMPTARLQAFRKCFEEQQQEIHKFLLEYEAAYIHFDFSGASWYELSEWNLFESNLNGICFEQIEEDWAPKTFLFKTLAANSGSLPNFELGSTKQARTFATSEEASSLFYALRVAKRATLRVGDIKVSVLPRGHGLTAKQLERFFEQGGLNAEEKREDQLERESQANQEESKTKKGDDLPANGFDPTFGMLSSDEDTDSNFLQFDFVFSKSGGTKPDVDLIEVSGVERSKLYDVARCVRGVKESVEAERDAFFDELKARFATKSKDKSAVDEEAVKLVKTKRPPIFLTRAFLNILGDQTTAKKKYQSHLLKVLPQIYTATYFEDAVLLPAFIEKVEFNVRNGEGLGFNLLKWDFFFLSRIQNSSTDQLMDIRNSPSYQVGFLLGQLARGLRSKINSFDKNYAGLISRRISNLPDVVRLHVEINQKLIMHSRAGLAFKVSPQLTEALKNFEGQYNKDQCAFGFFESYFAPYQSKQEEEAEEIVPDVVFVEEVAANAEQPA